MEELDAEDDDDDDEVHLPECSSSARPKNITLSCCTGRHVRQSHLLTTLSNGINRDVLRFFASFWPARNGMEIEGVRKVSVSF